MPLPLAVVGVLLILVGFGLYVMLVSRLYKRLRNAIQGRGYKSPALLTGAYVAAFTLPFACTLLMVRIVGSNNDALWWLLVRERPKPRPGLPLRRRCSRRAISRAPTIRGQGRPSGSTATAMRWC